MFKCANDECCTEIKPGTKSITTVTKIRTVGYTEQVVGDEDGPYLVGTGQETAQEVLLCRQCAQEAQDAKLEPSVVGHKVINEVINKHGKIISRDITMTKMDEFHVKIGEVTCQ